MYRIEVSCYRQPAGAIQDVLSTTEDPSVLDATFQLEALWSDPEATVSHGYQPPTGWPLTSGTPGASDSPRWHFQGSQTSTDLPGSPTAWAQCNCCWKLYIVCSRPLTLFGTVLPPTALVQGRPSVYCSLNSRLRPPPQNFARCQLGLCLSGATTLEVSGWHGKI